MHLRGRMEIVKKNKYPMIYESFICPSALTNIQDYNEFMTSTGSSLFSATKCSLPEMQSKYSYIWMNILVQSPLHSNLIPIELSIAFPILYMYHM